MKRNERKQVDPSGPAPEITSEDVKSAARLWKRFVLLRFRKLLDAKPVKPKE